jgi:hypothetical protein
MLTLNGRLDEQARMIQATSMVALASIAGAGVTVSMKGYDRCTIILNVLNGASGVVGGVIVLKQAKTVAGGSLKALGFSRMLQNLDVAADPNNFAETAVVSNTFTTDTTISKQLCYIMEVEAQQLDLANGFICVQAVSTLMAGTGTVGQFTYILRGARYGGGSQINPAVD